MFGSAGPFDSSAFWEISLVGFLEKLFREDVGQLVANLLFDVVKSVFDVADLLVQALDLVFGFNDGVECHVLSVDGMFRISRHLLKPPRDDPPAKREENVHEDVRHHEDGFVQLNLRR